MKRSLILALSAALLVSTSAIAREGSVRHYRTSWYQSGTITAQGHRYNPDRLTAAHRRLPFGTVLRVTDTKTGRSVIVTINDRGPYIRGRDLDLSRAAARAVGIIDRGIASVRVEIIQPLTEVAEAPN